MSAIGHEADRPLLDEAADVRASTPTGSAKMLVPEESVERENLAQARTRMSSGVQRMLQREGEWIRAIRSRPAMAHPQSMIDVRRDDLTGLRRRALFSMEARASRARDWVDSTRARVTSLSPQSTLDRGYAVVQTSGASSATRPSSPRPRRSGHGRRRGVPGRSEERTDP
ncbi:hypothetical protein [Nesterenkonia pannonica]|uniref:exodeoxyribonuclease VII large subunit n=1 Tax=Nesterenkonia pannonica TaxID=1548602 RepID=UPI002164ACB6|nr:exodeoxyribonuclease VII large subunit [Nesterenkonia pannonica]